MSTTPNKPSRSAKRVRFEDAMKRLEQIVDAVEKGEIGIEESIEKYEEAMGLVAQCRQILQDAELRVQKIQIDAQGRPEAVPFEADAAEPRDG